MSQMIHFEKCFTLTLWIYLLYSLFVSLSNSAISYKNNYPNISGELTVNFCDVEDVVQDVGSDAL